MDKRVDKMHASHLPGYPWVRWLMPILDGVSKSAVTGMIRAIEEQTGTPQHPVDWSDPNTWISERLRGDEAALARRIWEESGQKINPRHISGTYSFINSERLLMPDHQGMYRLTERGSAFLKQDAALLRELDEHEGLIDLLDILATKTSARRGDILPEWRDFLAKHSNYRTAASVETKLRFALTNLVERDLVSREGITYTITQEGIAYLASATRDTVDPKRAVAREIAAFNERTRGELRQRLSVMRPYHFEGLIRDLLEAMGYDNVTVTKQSGDKGVDVVATVQFGITTITEVVQVKRHQGSIIRPTLDQLRGALPYHKAIRGTLITLGTFSAGCTDAALFAGAAPITLIDGEKLLDLLIEHEVGVRKRPAVLYELDEATLDDRELDIPVEDDLAAALGGSLGEDVG